MIVCWACSAAASAAEMMADVLTVQICGHNDLVDYVGKELAFAFSVGNKLESISLENPYPLLS